MSSDLLKYLSDKIREEMKVIENDTVLGHAKDFGDYKYACGIYRGLLIANNILIETAERVEQNDD
jgi:ribosomal protein S4E